MLAEDEGFDLTGRQAGFERDERTEPRSIQLRAEADDFGRIPFQEVDRQPGQHVDRVGDDEKDRVFFQPGGFQRFQNLLEQTHVAIDQIQSAFIRLAAKPGGDADQIRIGTFLVAAGVDLLIADHARAMQ